MGATHTKTRLDAARQAKVCPGCGELKPFSDYYKLKTGANGLAAKCRPCVCAAERLREPADPARAAEAQRIRARRHYYKDVERSRLRTRASRRKHMTPARRRVADLKEKYGLTPQVWAAVFAAQGEVCAICGSDTPRTTRGWHTDHDHETGRFRGVLCQPCNSLLGAARDSQQVLVSAVRYLARTQGLTDVRPHTEPVVTAQSP